MNVPVISVSKSLNVGHCDPTYIPKNPLSLPGTATVNGPLVVGGFADGQLLLPLAKSALVNIITPATVTVDIPPVPTGFVPAVTAGLKISALGDGAVPYPGIGLAVNAVSHVISSKVPIPPAAIGVNLLSSDIINMASPTLNVQANELFLGTYTSTGARTKTGSETQTGAKAETGAKADTGARAESGTATQNANLNVAGPITSPTITRIDIALATKKSFDIKHPTQDNHRLRYICLEGPSADVYIRGRLSGGNKIFFPEYWKNLVHEESISVNLTSIGNSQTLYIKKITSDYILIDCYDELPIDCFYTVFGERKDVSKNIPEYCGNAPEDYPGDNLEYAINGFSK